MTLDWSAHYDALYDVFGTEAILTAKDSAEAAYVTVIDKVRAQLIDSAFVEVQGATATCVVRMSELLSNGFCLEELDGGFVTFNERCWRIEAHKHNSPDGKSTGQVFLSLVVEPSQE